MNYGFSKATALSYEAAIEKVTAKLQKEGFGLLTTIDVADTLKKKIDVDFQRYVILGACNPHFAHKALSAEKEIGLLLPCNVIVYETGKTATVAIFDPMVMGAILENKEIHPIALEVQKKLLRVFEAM
jgi:uncharacterized protein (DUF302 family)